MWINNCYNWEEYISLKIKIINIFIISIYILVLTFLQQILTIVYLTIIRRVRNTLFTQNVHKSWYCFEIETDYLQRKFLSRSYRSNFPTSLTYVILWIRVSLSWKPAVDIGTACCEVCVIASYILKISSSSSIDVHNSTTIKHKRKFFRYLPNVSLLS